MKNISSSCSKCTDGVETVTVIQGDNEVITERTCTTCSGTGLRSTLSLSDDLIDILNDIKDKVDDIFEKVNE